MVSSAVHNAVDRTGHRLGMVTVLGKAPSRTRVIDGVMKRQSMWYAQCDCGEKMTMTLASVERTKQCLKCWYSRNDPAIGDKVGCVTILSFHKKGEHGRACRHVSVRCDCGNLRTLSLGHLKQRFSDTCGCKYERHGYSSKSTKNTKRPEYQLYRKWWGIRDRCLNKNCKQYKHYGGRGVTICKSWMKFENFLKDMGTAPKGLSLDRIHPDGPYSKENCRWADKWTQSRNRGFNTIYRFNGEELTLGQWMAKIQREGELVSLPDIGVTTNVNDY